MKRAVRKRDKLEKDLDVLTGKEGKEWLRSLVAVFDRMKRNGQWCQAWDEEEGDLDLGGDIGNSKLLLRKMAERGRLNWVLKVVDDKDLLEERAKSRMALSVKRLGDNAANSKAKAVGLALIALSRNTKRKAKEGGVRMRMRMRMRGGRWKWWNGIRVWSR